MKAGWVSYRLDSVAMKITDGSHNPPKGVADSEFLMLSSKNVFDDQLHYDAPRYLTPEQFQLEDKRTRVAHGDVLLTIVGTIGRCAVVPENAPKITLQRSVAVIRPNKELVDPRFLMYLFLSSGEELNAKARGVAQKGIYLESLRELKVLLPNLSEQLRIVAILDEAFAEIATAKANAEKNLQNARALFESYLNKVFIEWGEGWLRKPLSAFCDLISGQHIDASDYNGDARGIGYLTGPSDFGVLNPVITKWTEYPKRIANDGDILITVKGSGVGKINLLNVDGVAISRQLMAIRPIATDVNYLYAFLSTKYDYFQSLASGAAIPGISRENVLNLICPIPPLDEQRSILEAINEVSEATQRLDSIYRQKLAALDELKQSLLHQAFSGAL